MILYLYDQGSIPSQWAGIFSALLYFVAAFIVVRTSVLQVLHRLKDESSN